MAARRATCWAWAKWTPGELRRRRCLLPAPPIMAPRSQRRQQQQSCRLRFLPSFQLLVLPACLLACLPACLPACSFALQVGPSCTLGGSAAFARPSGRLECGPARPGSARLQLESVRVSRLFVGCALVAQRLAHSSRADLAYPSVRISDKQELQYVIYAGRAGA